MLESEEGCKETEHQRDGAVGLPCPHLESFSYLGGEGVYLSRARAENQFLLQGVSAYSQFSLGTGGRRNMHS